MLFQSPKLIDHIIDQLLCVLCPLLRFHGGFIASANVGANFFVRQLIAAGFGITGGLVYKIVFCCVEKVSAVCISSFGLCLSCLRRADHEDAVKFFRAAILFKFLHQFVRNRFQLIVVGQHIFTGSISQRYGGRPFNLACNNT